ncbi:MAG TPA: hypothetical protein VGD02_08920 [Gemmatimonadaceae bacterium]
MQQEAIRMVADWFADATNGVNALLLVVPVESGDVPDPVTVNDATRHPWVSREEIPREKEILSSPILAVSLFDETQCKHNPQLLAQAWADADLVLSVRYIAAYDDAAKGERYASYTMRTVRSSLTLLGRHENLASRERNQVRIKQVQDVRVVPLNPVNEDKAVFGGLAVSLAMQDVIATPS